MDYNPLQMPCDWNVARKHALARRTAPDTKSRVDEFDDEDENRKPETCPCCGFEIERKEIPYCEDTKSLKFLGAGFPLFYNFLKFCMILLSLQSVVAIFNVLSNYHGEFCEQEALNPISQQLESNCKDSLFLKLSIANKLNNDELVILIQKANLIMLVVMLVMFQFFRRYQRKLDISIDESQLTPSDYTILVNNIPKTLTVNYRWELTNMFQNYAVTDSSTQIVVTKVVLVYDISDILLEESRIQKSLSKKKIALQTSGMKYDNQDVLEAETEILNSQRRIKDLQEEYFWTNKKFSGIAFVSFESEKMKDLVLQHNQSSFWDKAKTFLYQGKTPGLDEMELQWHYQKLFIEAAPEPNDIQWQNLAIVTIEKIFARVKSFFLTAGIMAIIFFLIYILSVRCLQLGYMEELEKKELGRDDPNQLNKIRFIAFGIGITIVLINKILLEPLMKWITHQEKISTNTKFQISYATKLTITLFVNAAILSYVIDILIFSNVYGFGGFLYNESIVFIFNAVIAPLIWLIDPWSLIKKLIRDHQASKVGDALLTQQEANELMEDVDYQLAMRYADIIKTMWFTFLFGTAIPIGVFSSLIGLIAYYLVDKYNLLRRRTVKESISQELSLQMIDLLQLIVLLNPLGNVAVTQFLDSKFDLFSSIGVIIGTAYLILPIHRCVDSMFPLKNLEVPVSYRKAQIEFDSDYDRENPVTKHKAIAEYSLQLQGITQTDRKIEYQVMHHED